MTISRLVYNAVWPFTWAMLKLFVIAMKIKHMKKGLLRTFLFITYGTIFAIADVLYNWTIGAIIFRQFPFNTLLFTDRLKKNKLSPNLHWELTLLTYEICDELNKHDPRHC